jgi:photosystem II stability/assembly factor-like uncharacterized protein
MATALTSKNGAIWIQKQAGKAVELLTCSDLDAITAPESEQKLIQCRNNDGIFRTVGVTEAAPGAPTTGLTALVFPERNILDELTRCGINLFALQRDCGNAGVFSNYVRGYILTNARITSRDFDNIVKRETDDPSTEAVKLTADYPLIQFRQVSITRQSIAETSPLNDINFCGGVQCASDCGEQKEAGQDGFIVTDGTTPSPAGDADVWITADGGLVWANATGATASPFAVGSDAVSVVCFDMDATTSRVLVARGVAVGQPAMVAYSDDSGANWTQVQVGSVNGEYAVGHGALSKGRGITDRQHIWFATNLGRIYFSDDAGQSWVQQTTALTASGGAQLNAVKFADYDNGWAVGNSGVVLRTTDGETWAKVTDPSGGDNITALFPWGKHEAIVGTNNDGLFETWDGGSTWDSKSFSGQVGTGTIVDLDFANREVGFMAQNSIAPLGVVHKCVDGGDQWNALATPVNSGLNALFVVDSNTAFVVGEVNTGTGFVAKIS